MAEQDQQVFCALRDPYRRVDTLESSRHLKIHFGGQLVIDSRRLSLVLESGLPPQRCGPRADVEWSAVQPSATTTRCQYKGVGSYWHIRSGVGLHEDAAWSYENPVPELPKLAQLISIPTTLPAVLATVDDEPLASPSADGTRMNPSMHHERRAPRPNHPSRET